MKNAIDSTQIDYSTVQQDKQSEDPLCDLQIFEGHLLMKSEDPQFDNDAYKATPKNNYHFETY